MASNGLRLYGHPESGHSYKVKLLLAFGNIDHIYEVVDITVARDRRPEPFRSLSLSRFGEVPLLVREDGSIVVQSNAILIYLAERHKAFGAETSEKMDRVREWLFWEANKIGLSLPHLRLARNYFPGDFPEGSVEWLERRYGEDSSRLEAELSDGRPFLLGDALTIADLSICAYFFWSNQAHVEVPTFTRAWLSRISQMPGWQSPYHLLCPSGDYETFGRVKAEYFPGVDRAA